MADIKIERKGEVEWIRLNRPDRMNAYDAEMAQELINAVEKCVGRRCNSADRNRQGFLRRGLSGQPERS